MNLPNFLPFPIVLALFLHNLTLAAAIYIGDSSNWHNTSFSLDHHLSTFDHDPPMHHHNRRWDTPPPANDDTWQRAICKGRNLLEAVRETDSQAAGRYKPPPLGMTVQSSFKEFPRMVILVSWSAGWRAKGGRLSAE